MAINPLNNFITYTEGNLYEYLRISNRVIDIFTEVQFLFYKDVRINLIRQYKMILMYAYNMNLICIHNFAHVNEEGDVKITDEKISEYASKVKEKLNYYNLASDIGDEIHYESAFSYSIGRLIAIELQEYYRNNPSYFKKEFNKVLLNIHNNGITAFEPFGITYEKLAEGKVLKRKLEEITKNK